MKLIVTGATGFVATELLRQAAKHAAITSVVTVSRSPVSIPEGASTDKFTSVIVRDYDQYTEEAKRAFAGADACIWTVGLTSRRYAEMDHAEATRICHTATRVGLQTIAAAAPATPFQFLYMSGGSAVRDQSTKLEGPLARFYLMRGDVENLVLAFATEHEGFKAGSVRPGLMKMRAQLPEILPMAEKNGLPTIALEDCCSAMLDVVINGFEKEPLNNDDIQAIADRVAAA
ncbi:unnamed protein product [Mycena citricolor]|uniref:NAD(P)-binding domain-containing protein n=1 Tax=Mycena citricolor TaxID=2018698 RepID=A0AAD2K1G1_9AGAR|nr:unnamed protein product [Mycena citricolor]